MKLREFFNRIRPRYRRDLLASNIKCHRNTKIFHSDRCSLASYVYIGPHCSINAQGGIRIGDGAILAPEVVILSSSHDYKEGNLLSYDVYDVHRPVEIGSGIAS